MCQHNVIGLQNVSNAEIQHMEALGFCKMFEWNKLHFFTKHLCDCSSFVGKLAKQPELSYECYMKMQKERSKEKVQQLFQFMCSENYKSRKELYMEKLKEQEEIYKKLHLHIEQYEEEMMDKIDSMGLSSEEEEQAYAKMYDTINEMESSLSKLSEYKKYEENIRQLHIGENQMIFDTYMLECKQKEEAQFVQEKEFAQEKIYENAVSEYNQILNDIKTLQDFHPEIYFGIVWNKEIENLKEKKCLVMEDLDMDELAHIKYGELLRVIK